MRKTMNVSMKCGVFIALVAAMQISTAMAEGTQAFRKLVCSGITAEKQQIEYAQCIRQIESEEGFFNDCQDFGIDGEALHTIKVDGISQQSTMAMRENLKIEATGSLLKVEAKGFNDGLEQVIDIVFDSADLSTRTLNLGSYDEGKLYIAEPSSVSCAIL